MGVGMGPPLLPLLQKAALSDRESMAHPHADFSLRRSSLLEQWGSGGLPPHPYFLSEEELYFLSKEQLTPKAMGLWRTRAIPLPHYARMELSLREKV